jgi:hypothetical protein
MHFCPHAGCDYRGWLGLGNIRANGHPSGGPWRQFPCRSCEGYFLETHGTIFHGKQVAVELIVRVLGCLAEGLGIRATARVFEVDPNTVLSWLVEAAEQLRAFAASFLCDLHVTQVQLDELYAVLRDVKAGLIPTSTLVANSKMGEMTLSILTAEGHRNWVDTCAEIAAAVGDRRAERIRHQCQHPCHEVQSIDNALSAKELQLCPVVGLLPQQRLKSIIAI